MKREITINNLSKKINNNYVLKSINLELKSGKIYGFRGKNGSGKTMLFRAICGLIMPSEGEIIIDGEKLSKSNRFPQKTGILIEHPGFIPTLSGYKNLRILGDLQGNIDNEEIEEKIKLMGLDPKSKKSFRKYSLGMKQRLGLAQALMGNPTIIILDEPTNGVDKEGIQSLKKILIDFKNNNCLILIASHDTEELNYLADEIISINNGSIV